MLPGIRFVCAAVILAVSLVVFGMGAAALLRSAHEEFASLPNRRPPPATVFNRQPEPTPTLAMLRTEPRLDEVPQPAVAPVSPVSEPPLVAAPSEAAVAPAPEEAIQTAAVTPPVEPEIPAAAEATPAATNTVIAAAPVEAVEPAPVAAQPPPPAPEPQTTGSISLPTATIMDLPNATLTEEDARLSSSKVAVLGGPPIDTAPVPLPNARPTAEPQKAKPEKKKVVKKPAVKRRPVAQRPAPVAATAQNNDPFGLSQLR